MSTLDDDPDGKVQGVKIPLFPFGSTQEGVLEWCDAFDAVILLAKAGACVGTHDVPLADQTEAQRSANVYS